MKNAMYHKVPAYCMVPNKKGEWISVGELWFYSAILDATLIVPAYSVNNLASIPRPFRNAFPVNGVSRPAAALHDDIYEKRGTVEAFKNGTRTVLNLSRQEADAVFREALQARRLDYYMSLPREIRNALADLGRDSFFVDADKQQLPLSGSIQTFLMHSAVRIGGGLHWSR